jgi:hypothetical protein
MSSNKFGIAPFDASNSLTKLMSSDSPPTEAEVENIKPLLTRIQSLKSEAGGGLIGTQQMAFFLQRRAVAVCDSVNHRPVGNAKRKV